MTKNEKVTIKADSLAEAFRIALRVTDYQFRGGMLTVRPVRKAAEV